CPRTDLSPVGEPARAPREPARTRRLPPPFQPRQRLATLDRAANRIRPAQDVERQPSVLELVRWLPPPKRPAPQPPRARHHRQAGEEGFEGARVRHLDLHS